MNILPEKKDIQDDFLRLLNEVMVPFSNYARSMTKTSDEAKDLISETVLIAYENFHKLRKKESFKYFLFTIASRLVFKKRLKNKIFMEYNEKYEKVLFGFETPADVLMDIEILYQALQKLPPKQYEAIVLFEISGFSIEEISKVQGSTKSGVKSRLKRAREKLKLLLDVGESNKTNGSTNKIKSQEFFKINFKKFYDKEIL